MRKVLTLSLLLLFSFNSWAEGLICKNIKKTGNNFLTTLTVEDCFRYSSCPDVRFYIDVANLKVRHFTDHYPIESTIERPCVSKTRWRCTAVLQTDIELVVREEDTTNSLVWTLRDDDEYSRSLPKARRIRLNRETLELSVFSPSYSGFGFSRNTLDDPEHHQKYACRFSAENEIEDLVRKENQVQIQILEDRVKEDEKEFKEAKEKRKL